MTVLVDSSVWVDYFRGGRASDPLDGLIREGWIATNELILAELLPALILRKQEALARLLRELPRLPMAIDWIRLVADQVTCLRHGINRLGLPDLLIAQNAMQHDAALLSLDKHFRMMAKHLPLRVIE